MERNLVHLGMKENLNGLDRSEAKNSRRVKGSLVTVRLDFHLKHKEKSFKLEEWYGKKRVM